MEVMTTSDPAQLRRTYGRNALDESTIAPTWLDQLRSWFDDAVELAGSPEPNAMQVATVDAAGHPSVRTVLAKGIDERGVTFFTNYDSVKGRDLDERPYAAAVFVWLAHERQARLSGPVSRVSTEETAEYFHSRPRGSQLGAWASPQSQVIASRSVLEAAEAEIAERFGEGEIDVPPFWGGFRIAPEAVEFWQGRPDRLHDRLRFRRDGSAWVLERLAP
jgi:pyridoxamine 5'-phosphate oxidase